MPTFLVTRRMSPALATRVQAAVSGRHARRRPLTAALRLLTFVFVLASVAGIVRFQRQRLQQIQTQRAELLATLERAGRSLTRGDRDLPTHVAAAIAQEAAQSYAGNLFAPELRHERELAETLSLPTLYLRGPLDALARPERVSEVAAGSNKDAFVLCLLAPPDARTEKALRVKASAANAGGKSLELTQHVDRLAPLLQALPLLGPSWTQRVQAAETLEALHGLQRLVDAAPLTAAVRTAKARQLLLVLDEAGTGPGPTELDGERAHPVRVVLHDLNIRETRLRFRHDVDPSWLSDRARAQYASGIDSCSLAMALRDALTSPGP